jgi:LysR family glycine cleavage system transcriptional activator
MDWTELPSLNALKAFSALAEAGNYTQAGNALNVTHAAVMQQVKVLENRFDVQLVTRSGRGVALTEDGEALARELEAGFARIQKGVDALTNADAHRPVQVTTSPVFAVKWLMPRIADFQTRHPDVTLLLNPTGRMMKLKPGGLDLAIRYCRRDTKVDKADVLIGVDLAIIGTPSSFGTRKIDKPADLVHLPWLQELGTNEVTDWLARHGVILDRPLMITHMPGNLIMDAIKRGEGITYTARQWVEDEIRSGQLVELFPEEDCGVFYIHARSDDQRRPVSLFIQWLKQQVSKEQQLSPPGT